VCYSPLHALEFANALHLKICRGQATPVQADKKSRPEIEIDMSQTVAKLSGMLAKEDEGWLPRIWPL